MGIGGAERVQHSLITGFDRRRVDPIVAVLLNKGAVAEELACAGYKVYDKLGASKFDLRIVGSLARIMRNEDVSLVHTCNYPQAMAYGRLAMMLAGVKPLVVALHSMTYIRRARYRNFALKAMSPFIAKLVAVSHGQKRHFVQTCGLRPDSIEVIYNGIDIRRFSPVEYDRSARAEFGIPEDACVVGMLAALRPEKRHDLFLEAARRIREVRKDVFFLLIGNGPERTRIESTVERLGLQEYVKLAGARADVPRLLRAMDVSVLCSAFEVLPVSLLECMAMELPVVSTNVGSIDEVVVEGTTGFLTPKGDANALAAKILELVRNRDLARQMGQAGRRRVEEQFTMDLMISRYEELFEHLVARHAAPSA